MKTHIRHILLAWCLCVFVAVFCAGCAEQLRFAPSESQKQAAELTHALALQIDAQGAGPGSPATKKLAAGTRAGVVYMGRPKALSDMGQFETSVAQAQVDAAQRPDPNSISGAVDAGLSLAAQLAILIGFGGSSVGGVKVLQLIAMARRKNQALAEIIKGNELYKKSITDNEKEQFRIAQNSKQSTSTKLLVAKQKL